MSTYKPLTRLQKMQLTIACYVDRFINFFRPRKWHKASNHCLPFGLPFSDWHKLQLVGFLEFAQKYYPQSLENMLNDYDEVLRGN